MFLQIITFDDLTDELINEPIDELLDKLLDKQMNYQIRGCPNKKQTGGLPNILATKYLIKKDKSPEN